MIETIALEKRENGKRQVTDKARMAEGTGLPSSLLQLNSLISCWIAGSTDT